MIAAECRDHQLGQRRRRRENDALGITRHEAGVVTGGRPRRLEERPRHERAVVIEGVVVAPERPAVGQTCPATQRPPDRQPVQRAQERRSGHRDPFPEIATARRGTLPRPPESLARTRRAGSGVFIVRFGERYGVEVNHEHSTIRSSHDRAHYRRHRLRPAGFEPATKGFKGPRVSTRLGLSHPPLRERRPEHPDILASETGGASREEAGRSRRGLLLGLTPLVSEPSWPPEPGQARLRIAVPKRLTLARQDAPGLGFPQFTRFAVEGYPSPPPFSDESPALPLS